MNPAAWMFALWGLVILCGAVIECPDKPNDARLMLVISLVMGAVAITVYNVEFPLGT